MLLVGTDTIGYRTNSYLNIQLFFVFHNVDLGDRTEQDIRLPMSKYIFLVRYTDTV